MIELIFWPLAVVTAFSLQLWKMTHAKPKDWMVRQCVGPWPAVTVPDDVVLGRGSVSSLTVLSASGTGSVSSVTSSVLVLKTLERVRRETS